MADSLVDFCLARAAVNGSVRCLSMFVDELGEEQVLEVGSPCSEWLHMVQQGADNASTPSFWQAVCW